MQTYYPTVYVPRLLKLCMAKGSEFTISVEWAGVESELEVDVTSTTWATDGAVSASNETTTDALASALLSADNEGRALVECVAEFEDGQIRKQQFEVTVLPSLQ